MTDNTQELDEILDGFARPVRVVVVNGLSHDKYERRQKDFKQAILDWHNKQVEEALYRLETQIINDYEPMIDSRGHTRTVVPVTKLELAIEAERAKLKEVK